MRSLVRSFMELDFRKAIRAGLLPRWYAIAMYATVIPTLVSTILAGSRYEVLPWPIKN